MNIRSKAARLAASAVLLSSAVALVAAPLAYASATVSQSAGSVPRGGTSTGTTAFQFTENSVNCFTAGTNALRVTILDSAGNPTVHFVGTPSVTAPGSLGATATLNNNGTTNNRLNISFAGADPLNVEQVTVGGLQVSADTGAATGPIQAFLTGSERNCVLPATQTASGVLLANALPPFSTYPAGATAFRVNVTSPCGFQPTGGSNGQLVFATSPESVDITATSGGPGSGSLGGNSQDLTTLATSNPHNVGEAVSQTVATTSCGGPLSIGTVGTVVNALTVSAGGATQVNIGENNQPAAPVTVSEAPASSNGTLNGESLTFTISAPTSGVVFSVAPSVYYSGAGVTGPATCALSVDRHSCTVSGIVSPGGASGSVTIAGPGGPGSPLTVDVDTTATSGTAVKVTVSASPALIVLGNPVTIAFVGRVIVATGAQPTIYIGFNDQPTGVISLTEQGPGFFVAGLSGNNTFSLCEETGEVLTRAPWAVVVTGDLKLLSGVVGASQVKGTLATDNDGETCAYWTVYSASTVASTIEIRGSANDTSPLGGTGPTTGADLAANGPRVNVPKTGFGATPGSTQSELLIGTFAQTVFPGDAGFSQIVSNAIRAFKNNVSVVAASTPNCVQGSADCLGGNITVTETQNGQFKAGDLITVRILPRATTQRQDVILKTGNTNDLPIVTTNAGQTGFAVTPVGVNCPPSAILGVVVCQFTFNVTQQAFGAGLGSFTISNIHYIVAADAVPGPVNVEVTNTANGGGQPVDVVVQNANVVTPTPPTVNVTTKTSASSAVGKTNNSVLFTVGTKVVHLVASSNNIVTIRIKVDPALVGKTVQIQVAHKSSSGTWGAFAPLTSRVIGSDGYAYYYASAHSAQWNSYRGAFLGGVTIGTNVYGPSQSQTVQVRWL